ncbi:unnamed protein product [Cylindrotheca closterium]|uniref:Uncharacterized protein n=1 Tax=Cylindrotheca closterium TaxID=2856 RepID=A0AAD2FNR4_9STRA|nr:unnamed protein product [Cylindrotheca closterium]
MSNQSYNFFQTDTNSVNVNNGVSNNPGACLFDAAASKNYHTVIQLFASNARNSVANYLSMKNRWKQQQRQQDLHQQAAYAKSEEKLDEFMPSLCDPYSPGRSSGEDETSYYRLLQELAYIVEEGVNNVPPESPPSSPSASPPPSVSLKRPSTSVAISKEADRIAWEASTMLSESRPPSGFCVYDRSGTRTPPTTSSEDSSSSNHQQDPNLPSIFDGSVANATPPPLGGTGTGVSGGAGTILHLACAMDQPLILAFLLCMGADGRASHTAFRRLMIHEAACNGSIQCLQLLLELGKEFAAVAEEHHKTDFSPSSAPFFPGSFDMKPRTTSRLARFPPPINMRYFRKEAATPSPETEKPDFIVTLRRFQSFCGAVQRGEMDELQAARSLLKGAQLSDSTRASLVRSCAFKSSRLASRSFLRTNGSSDGHGNTPLHWAAFKNETHCVSLLLEYDADPNARAHPSGWTPLHDAAYSNSGESIVLLISKGAKVDARANSGATPLCFAAQEDASKAAQLLLDRGADLTARCAGTPRDGANLQTAVTSHPHSRFSGYTPLHYCAHYNASQAARVLLQDNNAKGGMETPDLSGRLPIHIAVARGSSDVLRELLHAGARVDIRPVVPNTSPPPAAVTTSTAVTITVSSTSSPPLLGALPQTPPRQLAIPEVFGTPRQSAESTGSSGSATSPVTSPILRSMIPAQPIKSSKPWNCLTQQAIDECRDLIAKAEQSWCPDLHLLFTPQDRRCVMELLRVGKRLEQQETSIFVDFWPLVLSFCGRAWFEQESRKPAAIEYHQEPSDDDSCMDVPDDEEFEDYLSIPSLGPSTLS